MVSARRFGKISQLQKKKKKIQKNPELDGEILLATHCRADKKNKLLRGNLLVGKKRATPDYKNYILYIV